MKSCFVPFRSLLSRLLPVLALSLAAAPAMAQSGTAGLTHIEGSVAFAPANATEWSDARPKRPVNLGDRLWTDKGGRAEVQLGSATLHMDSQAFIEVTGQDRNSMQASLNEGSVNARVRQSEESFEINTPQLAFRALQPGDYRIDVDPEKGTTRVAVRRGAAMLYGMAGGSLQLQEGQRVAFTGRELKVAGQAAPIDQGFDRFAADRNRMEDRLIAARRLQQPMQAQVAQQKQPVQQKQVAQQDSPSGPAPDWMPNQHGYWQWIAPWGWTWVQPRMQAAPNYPPVGGWRVN